MTDLVERLRRFADNTRWHEHDQLSREAASTIEALSERIAVLENALSHAQGRFLNINICLSSGGSKCEAIGIADVGEDCVKMILARKSLTQEPQ